MALCLLGRFLCAYQSMATVTTEINVFMVLHSRYLNHCAVHKGHGCPCAALVLPKRPHLSCVVSVGWRPARAVAAPLFAYATCYWESTAQHGWCQRHISMAMGPSRVPVALQCANYMCIHPGCVCLQAASPHPWSRLLVDPLASRAALC